MCNDLNKRSEELRTRLNKLSKVYGIDKIILISFLEDYRQYHEDLEKIKRNDKGE